MVSRSPPRPALMRAGAAYCSGLPKNQMEFTVAAQCFYKTSNEYLKFDSVEIKIPAEK
jgi:hypothetical protein